MITCSQVAHTGNSYCIRAVRAWEEYIQALQIYKGSIAGMIVYNRCNKTVTAVDSKVTKNKTCLWAVIVYDLQKSFCKKAVIEYWF